MAGAGIRALAGEKPMSNKALSAFVTARTEQAEMLAKAPHPSMIAGLREHLAKHFPEAGKGDTAAKLTGAQSAKARVVLGIDRQMTNKDHTADFRGGERGGNMDHYGKALEGLRSAVHTRNHLPDHGSPEEKSHRLNMATNAVQRANADLAEVRAARSLAQNRSRSQGDLFGGFRPAPQRVSSDVWQSAASKKDHAERLAASALYAKNREQDVLAAARRALPYRAPAENPTTAKTKLSGPGTVSAVVHLGEGKFERQDKPSLASKGTLHVTESAGYGRSNVSTFGVTDARSGLKVHSAGNKTEAGQFVRGAHTGRTIDRLAAGQNALPGSKEKVSAKLAGKAVARYEKILQGRRDQAAVARTGFAGKIHTDRARGSKTSYRAGGSTFYSLKDAAKHLSRQGASA